MEDERGRETIKKIKDERKELGDQGNGRGIDKRMNEGRKEASK